MQKKINGNASNKDEFDIPAAPGKPDRSLKIKLDKGKSDKYDVWQKDIDAPTSVIIEGEKTAVSVTWFNSYGIKLRKNNADSTAEDPWAPNTDHEYTLEVSAEAGKRYVVHTGGSTAKELTVAGGKATIKIDLGDPPTGHI
jgi:hypothetical protein